MTTLYNLGITKSIFEYPGDLRDSLASTKDGVSNILRVSNMWEKFRRLRERTATNVVKAHAPKGAISLRTVQSIKQNAFSADLEFPITYRHS
ncbi:hypothetical protein V1478_001041 [Vespula squamosa]|uniref:Uncharacterized protein n=1 Tax=Vespula squamosa TaxID=30214 RepID=A0ABD2C787_VESSQ